MTDRGRTAPGFAETSPAGHGSTRAPTLVRARSSVRAAGSVLASIAAIVVVALAGCSPGSTGSPSSGSVAVPSLGGLGPPVTLAPGATPLVRIDISLLSVLPDEVDGLSVLESSEAEIDAQANGSLASLSDGVAGALAVDPSTADFVLVDVVRLRANALDDVSFGDWRDTFDAGVCGESGVIGRAQADIGGRTVFIGTCGNGLHTYHAWIQDKSLLVSASAGGSRQLGQLLFAALKP